MVFKIHHGINFCRNCFHQTTHYLGARIKVISDSRVQPSRQTIDVTLATFGSMNRVGVYERIVARWPGPKVVVFAIYNLTEELSIENTAKLANQVSKWNNTLVSWETVRLAFFCHAAASCLPDVS